jgi:hypothetical protein
MTMTPLDVVNSFYEALAHSDAHAAFRASRRRSEMDRGGDGPLLFRNLDWAGGRPQECV